MGKGGGWMLCGQSKFFSDLDFFKLDKTPKRMPEKSRSDVHVPKPISKMPCFLEMANGNVNTSTYWNYIFN